NRGIPPITDLATGEALMARIQEVPFTITGTTLKKGTEAPPRLFDLTSLQVECNKKFGYSADETLRLIQSLYEKKVATYPRVDTTFLSEDIYPKCPNILAGIKPYEALTAPLMGKPLLKSKKVFDNKKVTDHHAIIPTGQNPTNLTDMEKRVFDLIARRFIAVFYPDCKFSTTTVMGEADSIEFKVTGKQILEPGWRVIFAKEPKEEVKEDGKEGADEERTLPTFSRGESGPHIPSLSEKWTQPPRPFTEATLLRAMETAGKQVEDDELRDALKENGIGRPSTRAAIIETLFKRNYIKKERKNLIATSTGVELIGLIHEELLKSAQLTGIWEKKLREIERKSYQASTFLEELKQMVQEIVFSVLSDNTNRRVTTMQQEPPTIVEEVTKAVKKRKSTPRKKKETTNEEASTKATTASTENSSTNINNTVLAKETTASNQASESTAKTDLFGAAPITNTHKEGEPCPICGKGTIIKGKSAYGCSEWRTGCSFRSSF
ncbi:MAG: DNA topoisomerase, partial [Phocaeicola sp.]